MYNLKLLINNKYENVELDSTFSVNFNYQIKDFESPSDLKTNYSKTISIKGTAHNNLIFSNIYKTTSIYTSVNPNKRIEYMLSYNGVFVGSGYMIMNSISNNGKDIVYKATLYDDTTNLLYNLKYDELGNLRTLDKLSLGFADEFETYKYDLKYVMSSWPWLKDNKRLLCPNNETIPPLTDGNTISHYIVPIYCNTGLYEDFDSKKFLVQYNSDFANYTPPYKYNKDEKIKGYDETLPEYNVVNRITEDDKTYKPYKGWFVLEAERDLHPSEARCVMVDRLPLGIDLGMTWNIICNNFNIDDSEVNSEVHKILDKSYLLLNNSTKIESLDNTSFIGNGHYDTDLHDPDYSHMILHDGKVKFTTTIPLGYFKNLQDVTPENNTIKIDVVQKLNSKAEYDKNRVVYPGSLSKRERKAIEMNFTQTYYTENGKERKQKQNLDNFDYLITIPVNFLIVTYDIGYNRQIMQERIIIYPLITDSINLIEDNTLSKENLKQLIKDHINRYISLFTKSIQLTDYKINWDYCWFNYNLNSTNTNSIEIISNKISIYCDIYSEYKDLPAGLEIIKAKADTIPFTVFIPGVNYFGNNLYEKCRSLSYIRADNAYGVKIPTKLSNIDNYYPICNMKVKEVGNNKQDNNNFIISALDWVGQHFNLLNAYDHFETGHAYYSVYNQTKIIILPGAYLLTEFKNDKNETVSAYEVFKANVDISIYSYENTESFAYPEIKKDMLKNLKIGDLFFGLCKMFNFNCLTDIVDGTPKLKIVKNELLYNKDSVIDINNDVDLSSIEVQPSIIKSANYNYTYKMASSYSDTLLKETNPDYNIFTKKYDYGVSNDTIESVENVDFNLLTDYRLKSQYLNDSILWKKTGTENTVYSQQFLSPTKGVTFKQYLYYKDTTVQDSELNVKDVTKSGLMYIVNSLYEYGAKNKVKDKEYKLCGFDKELKPINMLNSIVSFNGFNAIDYPLTLSNDIPATTQLTGSFCYVLYPRRINASKHNNVNIDLNTDAYLDPSNFIYREVIEVPVFQNYKKCDDENISLGYTHLGDDNITTTLYDKFFKKYNDIFYDTNHKIIKCKVRFNSIDVKSLLRNVYLFDGSYWVINKLDNFDFSKEFNSAELVQINYNAL